MLIDMRAGIRRLVKHTERRLVLLIITTGRDAPCKDSCDPSETVLQFQICFLNFQCSVFSFLCPEAEYREFGWRSESSVSLLSFLKKM